MKVGNQGDESPEVYTIELREAGTLLTAGSATLTTVKEDGSAGDAVELSLDASSNAFSGTLANYTHLRQYNDSGFTVTLTGLPESATAQLMDATGNVLSDFVNGTATTAADCFPGSGSAMFYIAVTTQDKAEIYKMTLTKLGNYVWKTFNFTGTPAFSEDNVFYGQPEGTLFQADENGNRTDAIGYSKN